MRRNGHDEELRRLERAARSAGADVDVKRSWLHAVRRARGLNEVQRLARSNDPDILTIYGEFLDEEGKLQGVRDGWKDRLRAEAFQEHLVLAEREILVTRLDVEIDEENNLLEFPPDRPLRAWIRSDDRDVGRWIPQGDRIPHYLDPIYYVEVDTTTAGEHRELLEGMDLDMHPDEGQPWVHGPSIWLSGRVDFSTDWVLAESLDDGGSSTRLRWRDPHSLPNQADIASRVRSYITHRGRVLDAWKIYRSGELVEGGIARVRPTPLAAVELERPRWLVDLGEAWPSTKYVMGDEAGTGWQLEPQPEAVM